MNIINVKLILLPRLMTQGAAMKGCKSIFKGFFREKRNLIAGPQP